MTIAFSVGKYGGFYAYRGYTTRLCLGWFAVTFFPDDIDDLLRRLTCALDALDADEPPVRAKQSSLF